MLHHHVGRYRRFSKPSHVYYRKFSDHDSLDQMTDEQLYVLYQDGGLASIFGYIKFMFSTKEGPAFETFTNITMPGINALRLYQQSKHPLFKRYGINILDFAEGAKQAFVAITDSTHANDFRDFCLGKTNQSVSNDFLASVCSPNVCSDIRERVKSRLVLAETEEIVSEKGTRFSLIDIRIHLVPKESYPLGIPQDHRPPETYPAMPTPPGREVEGEREARGGVKPSSASLPPFSPHVSGAEHHVCVDIDCLYESQLQLKNKVTNVITESTFITELTFHGAISTKYNPFHWYIVFYNVFNPNDKNLPSEQIEGI